jgi:hypothetical protein
MIRNDIKSVAEGGMTENQAEHIANSLASSAMQQKTTGLFVNQWSGNPIIEDQTEFNGVIRWFPINERLQFPTFNLYLDGNSYLKVIKPVGEPQIVSVNIDDIILEGTATSASNNADITVKNAGDFSGGFTVKLTSCTTPFTPSNREVGVTLTPGQQTTVSIPVTFSSTGTAGIVTGTCTATMKETTSQETDTSTFNVRGEQLSECTPGNKFCAVENGETVVKQCNPDGLTLSIVETCGAGQTCEGGVCKTVGVCTTDAECDDGDPDTVDKCVDGLFGKVCTNTPKECTSDLGCDDGNVCTTDSCNFNLITGKNECSNVAIPGCGGDLGDLTLIIIAVIIAVIVISVAAIFAFRR